MSFTTILNGVTLANEPIGLDTDTSIQLVRDKDIQGLFTTLVSNLTFWGDGYDVIQAALVSVGLCGTIPISITEDCDVDPLAFEGLIYLSDVEIDEFKCTASVSAEDNSLASLVMRLKDTKVRVNNGLTIDGSTLTNIATTVNVGGTIGNIESYSFKDLFQHICNYITNNQLLVTSTNIFSNDYEPYIVDYTFTSAGLSGILRYEYIDYLGIETSYLLIVTGGLSNDQLAQRFAEGILGNSQFNTSARGLLPLSAVRTGNVVRVTYLQPITVTNFALPLGSSVVTSLINAGGYGARNVMIVPGFAFKGEQQSFLISFSDLVSIGSYYNLSFEFKLNGSQQEIEIDQEKYFFQSGAIETISNAKLIRQQTTPLSFASLEYAQQNDENSLLLYKRTSYVSQSCNSSNIQISNAVNTVETVVPNDPNEASNERLYLFEKDPVSSNISSYQSTYLVGSTITNGPIYYAGSIVNHIVAKQYINRAPQGLTWEGQTMPNNESIKIARTITFEAPLTRSQFANINANKKKPINVNGTDGWISNLTYNIRTGLTTFELLTE